MALKRRGKLYDLIESDSFYLGNSVFLFRLEMVDDIILMSAFVHPSLMYPKQTGKFRHFVL